MLPRKNTGMPFAHFISAFIRSGQDLFCPTLLGIMLKSALLTLLLFILGGAGLYAAGEYSGLLGGEADETLGSGVESLLYGLAAILIALASLWYLFRIIVILVIGFYADDIMAAVEKVHYPQSTVHAINPGVGASLKLVLRSIGRLLLANLLAVPFYIMLMVTGIGPAILFFLVNGWALGRDSDDMMQARYAMTDTQKALGRWDRLLLGLGGTFLLTLPLIHIIVPVLTVAMAVHLAHEEGRI